MKNELKCPWKKPGIRAVLCFSLRFSNFLQPPSPSSRPHSLPRMVIGPVLGPMGKKVMETQDLMTIQSLYMHKESQNPNQERLKVVHLLPAAPHPARRPSLSSRSHTNTFHPSARRWRRSDTSSAAGSRRRRSQQGILGTKHSDR